MDFDNLQEQLKEISFQLTVFSDQVDEMTATFEQILFKIANTPMSHTERKYKKSSVKNKRSTKRKHNNYRKRKGSQTRKKGGKKYVNTHKSKNQRKTKRK